MNRPRPAPAFVERVRLMLKHCGALTYPELIEATGLPIGSLKVAMMRLRKEGDAVTERKGLIPVTVHRLTTLEERQATRHAAHVREECALQEFWRGKGKAA